MVIKYLPYSGTRVSRRWLTVLRAADKAKVKFSLNSGHRTMSEQARLFKQNMRLVNGRWVQKPGRPLTAFPSPNAPHIFTGRHAHALDVNQLDGGEARLQKWLERKGARVTNPVRGEPWHMVVSGQDLKKLERKINPPKLKPALLKQTVSSKGRDFLASEEGLVPYAYNDPAGHATFGVGHLIHLGAVTSADGAKWGTKANPKSRAYAMRVFKRDLKKYEEAVRSAVGRRLPQQQFDACVSLCFNIGVGGFTGSTVAKVLRTGQPSTRARQAADAILLWDNPSMLRARRERERKLFLTGKYR